MTPIRTFDYSFRRFFNRNHQQRRQDGQSLRSEADAMFSIQSALMGFRCANHMGLEAWRQGFDDDCYRTGPSGNHHDNH